MHPVLLSLAVSLAVNAAFFAYAAARRTDVVTDLSYSLSFALVAIALLFLEGAFDPYRVAAAAMVTIWAARLGSYLLRRILATRVDHRFDGMRDKPLKFARFWTLQAITVAVVLIPASVAIGSDAPAPALTSGIAGFSLWLAGLTIEALADAQKSAFKRAGSEGFIRSGLWSWSRHPNYFGEALLWTGIYLYCLPLLGAWSIPALASPVGICALLLFVSGVPLLEKAADARYGSRPDYLEYKRATSVFIPLPPRKTRGA